MTWCTHCGDNCETVKDPEKGYICCSDCGKILDQDVYTDEPTFEKSGGQSRLAGSIIRNGPTGHGISRQRTYERGKDEISDIVYNLGVGGGESIVDKAHKLYHIAVDRNFTRGRRTSHVAAACLYIACRHAKKAYLLIDFSDYLKINVYVLGAVFLQLCKVLRLEEHPLIQKLVDPSLFIHRFTERLLGRKNKEVSETALRIVASMKRDWMQTGRKPSGLCGAALYISALSHGLNYSKSNIVSVVHVCEATLTKRLIEFEETESGSLTIEEFLTRADELDEESLTSHSPRSGEVLCKHKDKEEPHFAHGLCRKCYNKFLKISGGLDGGADPPAFRQAERQRIKKEKAEENMTKRSAVEMETGFCSKSADTMESESLITDKPERHEAVDTSACNEAQEEINDPESLSDIDDAEVDGYLHNEEEKVLKKIIWEEVNKDYVMEQAAKEAAAAAAKKARDELFETLPEEMRSAKALAEATAAALAKSRKEKRQKRAEEAKNATPAQTPLEATRKMLKQKAFSSRVNYKALEALYTEDEENMQKQQVESDTDDTDARQSELEKENADSGTVVNGEEADTFKGYNDGDCDDGDENYAAASDDEGFDDDFGF